MKEVMSKLFKPLSVQNVTSDELRPLLNLEKKLSFDQSRLATIEGLLAIGPAASKDADALLIAEELLADHAQLAIAVTTAAEISVSLERCRSLGAQATATEIDRAASVANLAREQRNLQGLLSAKIDHLKKSNPTYRRMKRRWWIRRGLTAIVIVGALGGVGAYGYVNAELANYHKRMGDFKTITNALDRHHKDRGAYPTSADNGASWNGIGWKGDQTLWIPDLVPTYLPALPTDPRKTTIPHAQYIYRSDGRDYKLIVLLPEDCGLATWLDRKISDPARNSSAQCVAYGLWTKGASAW